MTYMPENDPYCDLALDRQRNVGEDTLAVFVIHTTKIASSCFYWVKTGKYCARAAWVRTTSGGKTDGNIIQINKFCITKVFLPVASDRHQCFLPVTSWNYLKSTGRQATFRPLEHWEKLKVQEIESHTIPGPSKDTNLAHIGGRWALSPARQKPHIQNILCEMVRRVKT